MAKSDLLKQAIADAKAVKETALANAKIALQEAFAPRLESMLQSKLIGEIEGEDEMEAGADEMEAGADEMEMGADEMEAGADEMGDYPDSVNVGLDFNDDGEYDLTGMLGGEEEEAAAAGMSAMADEEGAEDEDLNLDEILRELDASAEEMVDEPVTEYEMPDAPVEEGMYEEEGAEMDDANIDEIIEAILKEQGAEAGPSHPDMNDAEETISELEDELATKDTQLAEAYKTVKYLKSVINEVNLLNAKLLYTNKLFRNFELNEGQKMKVIENFDRAVSTREAKLVFATLAESFKKPTQKRRMVKESAASRPTRTTAPSQQTTQILSEGFELSNRWKKLAGLI